MRKIKVICLLFVSVFASCGPDNIQKEKDKYPEITNFPKFQNNKLKSKEIENIKVRLNKNFKNQENDYCFNYLVRDSALYIITYFSDQEFPDIPSKGSKYIVDLVIIKNNKPVKHSRWKDDDFDLNFDVDKDHNVIVGRRKYLLTENYLEYEDMVNIDRLNKPASFKRWQIQEGEQVDTTSYFKSFERIIINSKGGISSTPSATYSYVYSPVFMIYYRVTYKNTEGLTKINYGGQQAPLLFKLNGEIYYISYNEDFIDIDNRVKEYSICKITT